MSAALRLPRRAGCGVDQGPDVTSRVDRLLGRKVMRPVLPIAAERALRVGAEKRIGRRALKEVKGQNVQPQIRSEMKRGKRIFESRGSGVDEEHIAIPFQIFI